MTYLDRLPRTRPPALRLVSRRRRWWRLDAADPAEWTWEPFPEVRHRFDSARGQARVRYAADAMRVAMRERFDAEGRIVSTEHLDLHVVEITGTARVLDLRQDAVLDALGLDDQVSTSRAPEVWAACQELADRVQEWFGPRVDGLVYRSRTTPQRSANLAFWGHAPLQARSLGLLRDHEGLLAASVASDGFTVLGW